MPMGEQTEGADANKASRQHMQQEAPQELDPVQRGRLDAGAATRTATAEAHTALLGRQQPTVGDRRAIGIAGQILEHVLGAPQGLLVEQQAVEDPAVVWRLTTSSRRDSELDAQQLQRPPLRFGRARDHLKRREPLGHPPPPENQPLPLNRGKNFGLVKAWRAPPAGRTGVRAGLLPGLGKGYVRRNVDPEVDAAGQEARATRSRQRLLHVRIIVAEHYARTAHPTALRWPPLLGSVPS